MLYRRAALFFVPLFALNLLHCGSESIVDKSIAPPVAAAPQGPPPLIPTAQYPISFSLEQSVTINATPGKHLAFPDVTRMQDGRLMVVYRQGATHVESSGKLMKQFGSPDGLTWTSPEVLYDEPGIDDRDPSITTLSSGEVLVNYFQYRTIVMPIGNLTVHHIFVGRSADNGQTFGPFSQIDSGSMYPVSPKLDRNGQWVDGNSEAITVGACSSPAIEQDGQIVMPAYGGSALNQANFAQSPKWRLSLHSSVSVAAGAGEVGSEAGVRQRSSDWMETPTLSDSETNAWLEEPALIKLASGTLVMHVRTAQGSSPVSTGKMLQSVSTDGQNWSDPTQLGFVGHAPALYQLKNGVVLTSYREIDSNLKNRAVSFAWSSDDGNTWSAPVRVLDCGPVECGYPSIVELDDQRFLIVYYAPSGTAIKGFIYQYKQSW